jgi:Protein of unknown function (DUF3995)
VSQEYRDTALLASEVSPRSTPWAAYTACAWALAFAAMSFYWAAGGTAGADTLGPAITMLGLTRAPGFVALLWATGALKALAGLLGLALVRPWGGVIPRRLLLTSGWGTGILLALYGGASWIQHGLMVTGVVRIPTGLGQTAALWHLFFWDPWWTLGGILFMAAAWHSRRTASAARAFAGSEM